jgi:hypothetical protein
MLKVPRPYYTNCKLSIPFSVSVSVASIADVSVAPALLCIRHKQLAEISVRVVEVGITVDAMIELCVLGCRHVVLKEIDAISNVDLRFENNASAVVVYPLEEAR